jgi:hypothetical protein
MEVECILRRNKTVLGNRREELSKRNVGAVGALDFVGIVLVTVFSIDIIQLVGRKLLMAVQRGTWQSVTRCERRRRVQRLAAIRGVPKGLIGAVRGGEDGMEVFRFSQLHAR